MAKRSVLYMLILLFIIIIQKPAFSAENQPQNQMDIKQVMDMAEQFKKLKSFKFNFQNIDLKLLTYFMAKVTGRNIIIDPTITGNVTFVSSSKITVQEAWDIFTSILKSQNCIILDRQTHYEILKEGVKKTIPPLKSTGGSSDRLITFTYEIKGEPNNLLNVVNSIKSPTAFVALHKPTNILVITEYESNVRTLQNIISILDNKDQNLDVKAFKLDYITGTDAVNILTKLFGDLIQRNINFVVSEVPSYGVIVKTQKNMFESIEEVIKQIDINAATRDIKKFYTYTLVYAKADEVADVINKALDNLNLVSADNNSARISTSQSSSTANKPKVIADKPSNSIIILGNAQEYSIIKSLIDSLDVRKRQVMISAIISEVSDTAIKELGVRWQIITSQGGAAYKGGLSANDLYAQMATSGFATGVMTSSGRNIGGMFFPDLLMLFSLAESGTGFHVISSPRVLTVDNAPAQITVSQVIPFASSVKYDINGNPLIGYDYKEVGIKLKLTPRISETNIILDIHQEANDVIGYEKPTVGNVQYMVPITSKRELETQVNVDNGKTVVLGGMVSKKTTKTMDGIPFFKDIPLVGRLFRYDKDQKDTTYLFIFITPHIINTPQDLAKITEEHQKLADELNKRLKDTSGKSTILEEKMTNPSAPAKGGNE